MKAELEREASEWGASRSEYIRNILTDRHRVDELKERLGIREERIDESGTQLAERSQIQEQIEDLPDKIRVEMTYQERRQRMLDQASLAQRIRWKVTGVPVDETVDEQR